MRKLVDLLREYKQASELPQRLRLGDEIVRLVGPPLRAFILRHAPGEIVEDAYSDVLGTVCKQFQTCKGDTDRECWGWVYGVAHNRLCNLIRSEKRELAEPMDMNELGKVHEASAQVVVFSPGDRLDAEYVENLLRKIEMPCYAYLMLRYGLEYDWPTMAKEFGLTADAVRKRTERCLELARQLLGEQG